MTITNSRITNLVRQIHRWGHNCTNESPYITQAALYWQFIQQRDYTEDDPTARLFSTTPAARCTEEHQWRKQNEHQSLYCSRSYNTLFRPYDSFRITSEVHSQFVMVGKRRKTAPPRLARIIRNMNKMLPVWRDCDLPACEMAKGRPKSVPIASFQDISADKKRTNRSTSTSFSGLICCWEMLVHN